MFKWEDREYVNPRKRVFKNLDTNEILNLEIQDDPNNIVKESQTPLTAHNLELAQQELVDDISKTYKDTNITANTVEGIGRINKVYGFCKQEKRSGKNIFNLEKWFKTSLATNCTAELLSNEEVRLNFTAGADAFIGTVSTLVGSIASQAVRPALIEIKPSTKYTFSLSSSPKCYIAEYDENYALIELKKLPNTSDKVKYIFETHSNGKYIQVRLGIQNSNYTTYTFTDIQIEEGEVATEYEQYGSSPSVEFPSEIHCLGDDVNLYNLDEYSLTDTCAYNEAGEQVWWSGYRGIQKYFEVNSEETYTFSNNLNISIRYLVYYNEAKEVIKVAEAVKTFTTPKNCKYIRFTIQSNKVLTKVKLQKSSVVRPWSPFRLRYSRNNIKKRLKYKF